MKNISNTKKYISNNKLILILEIYLIMTVIIFFFGPFEYSYDNLFNVIILSVLYPMAIFIGYYIADKKLAMKIKDPQIKGAVFSIRIVILLTIVSIIINYLHLSYIINNFNLFEILNSIKDSIFGLGDAYLENIERGKFLSGSIITKLVTLFSPILQLSLVTGLMNFVKLSIRVRTIVVVNVLFTLSVPIIKGQNFGIFAFIILLLTLVLITSRRNIKRKNIFIFLSFFFFLMYFSVATIGRLKPSTVLTSLFGISINQQNWMFTITPQILHNPIILITSYISQGYYGFSLALGEKFTSTFGLGSGYFPLRVGRLFFGVDMFDRTYQAKISESWHPQINWHTAYTWFANDFSFFGVFFIMLIIGACLYVVLIHARKGSVIAISLLPLYVILILFLPMNNVILGNSTTAFQFVTLNLLFIYMSYKPYRKLRSINEK